MYDYKVVIYGKEKKCLSNVKAVFLNTVLLFYLYFLFKLFYVLKNNIRNIQ